MLVNQSGNVTSGNDYKTILLHSGIWRGLSCSDKMYQHFGKVSEVIVCLYEKRSPTPFRFNVYSHCGVETTFIRYINICLFYKSVKQV